jgi:hypothetical protein
MPFGLLAFFAKASYPKPEPEFAAHVGWLVLGCTAALLVWAWCRAESFRRGVLGREDPRVYAVLRVGVAIMTIQCFWNLEPYWRMLWSDEGIFLMDQARERLGRTEMRGWTTEDGFLGWWGVWRFVWGKQSLLYIHGHPDFVRTYLWVFLINLGLYAAGFRTRITGVVCWFLMIGIYNRNALYLEGTDTVYKVFWVLLILAPTGRAWSIDNYVRVWRERRRQRLDQRGFDKLLLVDRLASLSWVGLWGYLFLSAIDMPKGPLWLGLAGLAGFFVVQGVLHGLADDGQRDPVIPYSLVPRWSRVLMMAQLAAIYTTTGLVKTGTVWARGDALYYALNMDHFYRFENLTQQISALVSLNLFRIATWVTHWWEMLFPVVIVGMILRFGHQHRDEPWYRAQQAVRWRVWLSRLALLSAYLLLYRINVLAYPFGMELVKGKAADPTFGLQTIHAVYAVAIPLAVAFWFVVGRRPLTLPFAGRKIKRLRLPRIVVDQEFLRRWLLGRRIWLGCGVAFHGFLILFMNIGMFPFIMLASYVAYTESPTWTRILRGLIVRLRSRPRLARLFPENADELVGPPQDPATAKDDSPWFLRPYLLLVGAWTLLLMLARRRDRSALAVVAAESRRREARIPDLVILGVAAAGFGLIALRSTGFEFSDVLRQKWLMVAINWWTLAVVVVAAILGLRRRSPDDAPGRLGKGPVIAAGSLTRTLSLLFCLWHATTVATILFPAYPIFAKWRAIAKRPFSPYTRVSGVTQSWKMFAPNPPRGNSFMQTIVVEADGDRWDLRSNAFSYRPNPWIFNDRMRKMQRRMVGKGKWYLRYWASFQCREWALATGELPQEIRVNKLVTPIPKPEVVWRNGPYVPRELKVRNKHVQTHECRRKGELPAYMKERYGLELSAQDLETQEREAERARKRAEARRRSWERRKDFGGTGPKPKPPS